MIDKVQEALESLKNCRNYNRWLFSLIEPYVGRRVLEAGSGIGTISQFLKDRDRLILLDNSDEYIRQLKMAFGAHENSTILKRDLNQDISDLKGYDLDTIICINVLEHIDNDEKTLRKFHDISKPGSRIIILVPAMGFLYSDFDVSVGHRRRYSIESLTEKILSANFNMKKIFYFNFIGAIGWFIAFKMLHRQKIYNGGLALFDRLIFLLSFLERRFPMPFGMSVIAVCERPKE